MAWTTEDRDAVQQAITDLAAGKRRARVSWSSDAGGGTTEYAPASLSELRSLLNEINASIGRKRRSFRVRTSK